ncbi:hypothetical protein [Leminorella grimontii]|uniref:hypothetical protein n=1 Tax=Leminorella grimontii TaxID=82981 RepID=UPI00322046CF
MMSYGPFYLLLQRMISPFGLFEYLSEFYGRFTVLTSFAHKKCGPGDAVRAFLRREMQNDGPDFFKEEMRLKFDVIYFLIFENNIFQNKK